VRAWFVTGVTESYLGRFFFDIYVYVYNDLVLKVLLYIYVYTHIYIYNIEQVNLFNYLGNMISYEKNWILITNYITI